jgi:hypothetical protein
MSEAQQQAAGTDAARKAAIDAALAKLAAEQAAATAATTPIPDDYVDANIRETIAQTPGTQTPTTYTQPTPAPVVVQPDYVDANIRETIAQTPGTQTPTTYTQPTPTPLPSGPSSPTESIATGTPLVSQTTQDKLDLKIADIVVQEQKDIITITEGQLAVANEIISNADQYDFSTYTGGKTQYIKDVAAIESQLEAAKVNLVALQGVQTQLLIKTSGVESVLHVGEKYTVTYVDNGKTKTKTFTSKYDADHWAKKYDLEHQKYKVTYQSEGGKEVSVEFSSPDTALRFQEMLTEVNVAQAQATSKLLSGSLWDQSKNYSAGDVEKLLGIIPYSPKGAFEIKAILAGSLENIVSPILNLIPDRQPFEVLPTEMNISWKNLEGRGLSADKLFVGQATGATAELLGTYLGSLGVGYVAGAGLGLAGSAITRIPKVGDYAFKAGAAISKIGSGSGIVGALGKTALIAPIAVFEGAKLYEMNAKGEPIWKITAQGAIDLTGMVGFGQGLTKGIQVGQSIPNQLSRLINGGVTVKSSEVIPEYVLSGEKGFPQFGEEPYPPTPEGYRQMALRYTPEELRIAGKVPSFHATDVDIVGALADEGAAAGRHGTGMFWAPATSPNFLRVSSEASLSPGLPNIFGQPTLLQGSFDDVITTGLSKSSGKLVGLGEKYLGTGTLMMPVEQLGEAQAIIPAGTKFVSTGGRFWLDFGDGVLIEIKQVLPEITASAAGLSGAVVDVAKPSYSLTYSKTTPYLPTVASMAATGFSLTGKVGSVSLTPAQTQSLVKIIKTGELSSGQLSSALRVLSPSSLGEVMKVAPSSTRNDIIRSMVSSGDSTSVVEAINTLTPAETSEVVSSLTPSTVSSIGSISETGSGISNASLESIISKVDGDSIISDIDSDTSISKVDSSIETVPPPPTIIGRGRSGEDKRKQDRINEEYAGAYRVTLTHRHRESPQTLAAESFHEALARVLPSGSSPRVVEVVFLGRRKRG